MSQFLPLPLVDSKGVTHNFVPVNIDSAGVAKWNDKAGGIPIGFPILTKSVKAPNPKGAQNYKVTVKVALPTLEVLGAANAAGYQAAPSIAYTHYANVEFVMPARGTQVNREDLVVMLFNLFNNAAFVGAVTSLDSEY